MGKKSRANASMKNYEEVKKKRTGQKNSVKAAGSVIQRKASFGKRGRWSV